MRTFLLHSSVFIYFEIGKSKINWTLFHHLRVNQFIAPTTWTMLFCPSSLPDFVTDHHPLIPSSQHLPITLSSLKLAMFLCSIEGLKMSQHLKNKLVVVPIHGNRNNSNAASKPLVSHKLCVEYYSCLWLQSCNHHILSR